MDDYFPRTHDCPACGGDEFGCCVCDHTGRVTDEYYALMAMSAMSAMSDEEAPNA